MSKLMSARPDSPVFLTLKELAELLRVKPRTIYDWVANERKTGIPVERAGGSLRFRLDKVLQWTEGRARNVKARSPHPVSPSLLTAQSKRVRFQSYDLWESLREISKCGAAYIFNNPKASATISLLRAAATGRSNRNGGEKARELLVV